MNLLWVKWVMFQNIQEKISRKNLKGFSRVINAIGQRRASKKSLTQTPTPKEWNFFVRLKIRIHRNSNIMSSLKDKQAMKIPFPFRRCKRALRNFLNCDETYYLVIKITACNSHLQRKYLPEWNAKMPIIL